eukprot:4057166-Pleurochrysis_carterae.AAC.2
MQQNQTNKNYLSEICGALASAYSVGDEDDTASPRRCNGQLQAVISIDWTDDPAWQPLMMIETCSCPLHPSKRDDKLVYPMSEIGPPGAASFVVHDSGSRVTTSKKQPTVDEAKAGWSD